MLILHWFYMNCRKICPSCLALYPNPFLGCLPQAQESGAGCSMGSSGSWLSNITYQNIPRWEKKVDQKKVIM